MQDIDDEINAAEREFRPVRSVASVECAVKHMPGPWQIDARLWFPTNSKIEKGPLRYTIKGPNGELVCDCFRRDDEGNVDANLIAAAPDMLAALKEVIACNQMSEYPHLCAALTMARLAIAKAEGHDVR